MPPSRSQERGKGSDRDQSYRNNNNNNNRDRSRTRDKQDRNKTQLTTDDKEIWGKQASTASNEEENNKSDEPVYKPNFGLTGALAKDENFGNIVNGVVLKFSIPLDSAKPAHKWRLYVFKDDQILETFHIHRKSSYLAGRDERVSDIILSHPSCSKQHAVIHYRSKDESSPVIPYLMDLKSTHKTFLNGKAIQDSRYYELREKDCIKFGGSTREYILLHAFSQDGEEEEEED